MKQDLQELAQKCDYEISQAWEGAWKRTMKIGWYGRILKQENLFGLLGYADEHDYWKQKRISRSTWYRMVRIADAFASLDVENFCSMLIENAELLMEEPVERRYDSDMIQKAAAQTATEFEETLAISAARRQHRKADELPVTWKLRMNRLQRNVIESKLKQWQQEHDITDEAYALELLVVEYTDRLTLVGYFSETIERLRRTANAEDLSGLRKELQTVIQDMQEALIFVLGEKEKEKENALEEVA